MQEPLQNLTNFFLFFDYTLIILQCKNTSEILLAFDYCFAILLLFFYYNLTMQEYLRNLTLTCFARLVYRCCFISVLVLLLNAYVFFADYDMSPTFNNVIC